MTLPPSRRKPSLGKDIAIGVGIAAIVLGGFYAGKELFFGDSARRTGSPSSETKGTIALAVGGTGPATVYVDGVEKGWAERWRANGWKRNKKEKAINPDLWGRLLDLAKKHEVTFHWVKGHAGHRENERCDQLANSAGSRPNLLEDAGYGCAGSDVLF